MRSGDLMPYLPALRRFARAVTGDRSLGDRLVRQGLERLVGDSARLAGADDARLLLFKSLLQELAGEALMPSGQLPAPSTVAERHLLAMTPLHRQAFLLSSMEGFAPDTLAQLFDVSSEDAKEMLAQAHADLEEQIATTILIIEDEAIIAMDLQALVEDMGHHVIANARTREEAVALSRDRRPGLILADIQLADRSSGIDAVNDILVTAAATPVIFITAFPNRLLTGDGQEPTYVMTKPFDRDLLRATIAQALFFGDTLKQGQARDAQSRRTGTH